MGEVRIGVIGIGGMGSYHAREIHKGNVPSAALTAVCDVKPDRIEWAKQELGEQVATYGKAEDLIGSGRADAVIIATPHYDHPPLAIRAFRAGLHVMSEKPVGVYTRQAREMNEAAAASGKVFQVMFQMRTSPVFRKVKDLLDAGELGELRRFSWIVTAWYRCQAYYDSGGWRATWGGEGGGVLMNQCPHNLDLWQWYFGLPERVRASCYFGKYHNIEVEDEVFAEMQYANGAVGTFVTSTGEAPGVDRLEVFGDRGRLTADSGGGIEFRRNRVPVTEHMVTCQDLFAQPEAWDCKVPHNQWAPQGHNEVMKSFVRAITEGGERVTPGEEGIRSLELANAMLLSAWTGGGWVDVPVDEDAYYEQLRQKVATSTFKKQVSEKTADDMFASFR